MFSSYRSLPRYPRSSPCRLLAGVLAGVVLGLTVVAPGAVAAEKRPAPASDAAADLAAAPVQYRVNSGDELDIFVWGEDRMQRAVRVQPDGTFAFPLAGTITAVGRGTTEIADEIRERIAVNYRSAPPDVTVSVRDATGMRIYVLGKVRTPGSYTSGKALNILQALSMAGGLAEFADVKHAVILRQTSAGQVVEPVHLRRLLKGARKLEAGALGKPLPTLSSGDVLVIP
jgi:polysaccharide biosynthesis/export protein